MDEILYYAVDANRLDEKQVLQPAYDRFGNTVPVKIKGSTTNIIGAWQNTLVVFCIYDGADTINFRFVIVEATADFNRDGNWNDEEYIQAFWQALINRRMRYLHDYSSQ